MAERSDDMGDTRYLRKPRDKGFTLKMPTPKALIGKPNPRTGKVYGKEIYEGLHTRNIREARRAGPPLERH